MSSPSSGPPGPGSDPSPQVLVVEDDPSVRGLLDTLLTSEGYRVTTASDGIEGLSEAAAHRPAVILLDIVMPDLGGMRVLEEMQANPMLAGVPVLVLTGRLEAIGPLQDQLGADRVFSKPFGVEDLLARIAELTGKAPTE
ncbi:MAG: DNA-binding response regulator [Mycobacterium sp.]|jgi:DNA-binding response OmpR family regulator|nr:DNA-binding response regulator [Mycobacterium sp.]